MKFQYSQYPIELFKLLRDNPCAVEIKNERPCAFDDLSAKFVQQKHKRRGGLKASDCVAELTTLATIMEFDKSAAEAAHAKY